MLLGEVENSEGLYFTILIPRIVVAIEVAVADRYYIDVCIS
jgi:hypothetical protein